MSLDQGVHSITLSSLEKICDLEALELGKEGHWLEFGIRWEAGELAEDLIVLDTDRYYDGPDTINFNGQSYSLEFGEDLLVDVLGYWQSLPIENRISAELILRYNVEFDAVLLPSDLMVGGKWIWGGMRGRPNKREPIEFCRHWRIK